MIPSIQGTPRAALVRPKLARWLPPAALALAVLYCACGVFLLGHRAPSLSEALLPLRLFVLAAVPMAAALACLWLEQAVASREVRRRARALVLVAAAVVVVLLANGAIA